MDARDLYRRAVEGFGARVHTVKQDQWHRSTPCTDWDVHTLVNHVAGEAHWTPPLLAGQTIAEVGDRFEGDLLGDDPYGSWDAAATEALASTTPDGVLDRVVHTSSGETPAREYLLEVFADNLIHSWDLARATGGDEHLDPQLVEACARWFDEQEPMWREWGVIGPRVDVPDDADPQTALLARFGRTA